MQPVERTVIDRCVRQMYREHLQNPETAEMPTLQTLYDLLCAQPEGEAVRLATSLEIYVSGSLNVFNHKTNVDLNRRLVCLDLKKLGAGLRTIAMLIMQDLVNSQVSLNFLRGIATWCYVRKMALNGYILHVDLAPVKELVSLQRRCSNNLNQVAVHANTYGVYPEEIDGLRQDYEKLWGQVSEVLRELSALVAK